MKEKKQTFFQKIVSGFPERDREPNKNVRVAYEDEYDYTYPTETRTDWNIDTEVEEELDGELSIDMYQTEKDLVIEAMIAGVKPEDIQLNITRDIVTISGKREANKSVVGEDYFYQELYWGTFSRSIMLPHEIDIESAEAIEKHGMLIIKMPKTDKGRQNKLKVKSL
jgi:HSP20 family protein